MKNREINEKLNQAFSHITPPGVLDSVLSDCEEQKGRVRMIPQKKRAFQWTAWAAGIAAAVVLVAAGGFGVFSYQSYHTVASTVSLDVNPSVEIKVNTKEKVLAVTPKNEDAKVIVGDMDFRGNTLDVTVNALIGSMLRNGYLTELANSVLVSVDSGDPARGKELQKKLAAEINNLLQSSTFSGSVLSQTVSSDARLQTLADQYGITLGKARLIQEIVEKDNRYNFEGLSKLSINELNLLRGTGTQSADPIDAVGNASDKAYIGESKAKAAALSHAKLSEDDIRRYTCEFDYENGVMVYEIEFHAGGYEYGYDINATTGAVVDYEKERNDDAPATRTKNQGGASGNAGATKGQNGSYIGKAKAKSIALSHAGLKESAATILKCEMDDDDGRMEYEIEFVSGTTKYEYEIDARNGTVLQSKREKKSTASAGAGNSNGAVIGEAKAKSIAFSHAGVSSSQAGRITCKLDYEDGTRVYEVEFQFNGYEYSYDINAATGAVINHEKEVED